MTGHVQELEIGRRAFEHAEQIRQSGGATRFDEVLPNSDSVADGVTVDAAVNVLIADQGDHVVREVNHSTRVITTIAGTERTACSTSPCGDGGPATSATLQDPSGVAVDAAGDGADRGPGHCGCSAGTEHELYLRRQRSVPEHRPGPSRSWLPG